MSEEVTHADMLRVLGKIEGQLETMKASDETHRAYTTERMGEMNAKIEAIASSQDSRIAQHGVRLRDTEGALLRLEPLPERVNGFHERVNKVEKRVWTVGGAIAVLTAFAIGIGKKLGLI